MLSLRLILCWLKLVMMILFKELKYMIKYQLALWIVAVITLGSCGGGGVESYMAFDDVEYVEEFPLVRKLQSGNLPNIDVIGTKSFAIRDSIMILSTTHRDSLWVFLSLPGYQKIARGLKLGGGPDEFVGAPSVANNTKFYNKDGALFAYLFDGQKGKLMDYDVTNTLNTGDMSLRLIKDSLSNSIFSIVPINDSLIMLRGIAKNATALDRTVLDLSTNSKYPVMSKLNDATIEPGEDINILSAIIKHNPANDIVVEMPIGLNYINMYTLNGELCKTICVGKKMLSLEKVQRKMRWDRPYTFADLRLFQNFWGVLLLNETELSFQTIRKNKPSVLLFDWDGYPLANLKLDDNATSFDINFASGELITFDHQTELFKTYLIGEILGEM